MSKCPKCSSSILAISQCRGFTINPLYECLKCETTWIQPNNQIKIINSINDITK